MFTGQCHCGNVQFSVARSPSTLTECNCSICHRYGTRWAYFKPEEVSFSIKQQTQSYRWGDEKIDFHHCSTCGCLTHYTATEKGKAVIDKIALNSRMCPIDQTKEITIRHFDGADSWTFLD